MLKQIHNIPWVEKYRPDVFENVILESRNKLFFKNILKQLYFPHLLIYGAPGTGKTTTIINLIDAYQLQTLKKRNCCLIVHLNASDERGIDIIRLQINQFVHSKSLFETNQKQMKFIILDEVDYMTKTAQQALRYLLQLYNENVRFCLICNYISRIDLELQNELIKIHFNELPKDYILSYLQNICIKEKLDLEEESLRKIQENYKSDLRSMINFLQMNQYAIQQKKLYILNNSILLSFVKDLQAEKESEWSNDETNLQRYLAQFMEMTITYNVDPKTLQTQIINILIRLEMECITSRFLDFVENILHNSSRSKTNIHFSYFIFNLYFFLNGLEENVL